MIYSLNNETHGKVTHALTWMYAHGNLETFLGYDLICTDSLDLATKHILANDGNSIDTHTYVFDEKATNESGEVVEVKVYLWRSGGTARGLVVDKRDKLAIAHALDLFERLSPML